MISLDAAVDFVDDFGRHEADGGDFRRQNKIVGCDRAIVRLLANVDLKKVTKVANLPAYLKDAQSNLRF